MKTVKVKTHLRKGKIVKAHTKSITDKDVASHKILRLLRNYHPDKAALANALMKKYKFKNVDAVKAHAKNNMEAKVIDTKNRTKALRKSYAAKAAIKKSQSGYGADLQW